MRGKLTMRIFLRYGCGITPADAGKTEVPPIVFAEAQDHPRGCGENEETGEITDIVAGSPPRMRGKQLTLLHADVRYGITPADAGKTINRCFWDVYEEDHPRGCGENACGGEV